MKVKFLVDYAVEDKEYKAGKVVDVDDEIAIVYIIHSIAQEAEEKKEVKSK